MRPVIGVLPLWDEEKNSLWMLPGYMEGIEQAGGLPLMLPLTAETEAIRLLSGMFDGFLVTGGQDVDPALYGADREVRNLEVCEKRDQMERALLETVLGKDLPVFGICRGIQVLNAVLGGTLYQDLPVQHPSSVCHRQAPPYDVPCHTVRVVKGTPLHALLETDETAVNSCHHQAVKDLSPKLSAMAFSPDHLVESAYMPDRRFVWAVQWHPECFGREHTESRKLFSAFVDACRYSGRTRP